MIINQNPPANQTPKHLETQKRPGIYDDAQIPAPMWWEDFGNMGSFKSQMQRYKQEK